MSYIRVDDRQRHLELEVRSYRNVWEVEVGNQEVALLDLLSVNSDYID